jgi:hypothetical protein
LPREYDRESFIHHPYDLVSPFPYYEPLASGIRIICFTSKDIHLNRKDIEYPFFYLDDNVSQGYLYYFYGIASHSEAMSFIEALNAKYNANLIIINSHEKL